MAYGTTTIIVGQTSTPVQATDPNQLRIKKFMLDCWFPSNPTIVKSIKEKLRANQYPDIFTLLSDLQDDFGLYTYCLRQLAAKLNTKSEISIDPTKVQLAEWDLTKLSVEELEKLIPSSASRISKYQFEEISDTQVQQLQNFIISTTAADFIAKKLKLLPTLVFTAAMIRQLPTTLVAFNYPRVFQKFTGGNPLANGNFDQKITSVLGCSPIDVTSDIVGRWPVATEVKAQLDGLRAKKLDKSGKEIPSSPPSRSKSYELLNAICQITEALTTCMQSESSDELRQRWKWGLAQISQYLGPQGIVQIESEIQQKWRSYAELLPVVYKQIFSAHGPKSISIQEHVKKKYVGNTHISKCARITQEAFLLVYKQMKESKPSQEALQILISDLIPSTGFDKGCIYLTEESKAHFSPIPTVMIGSARKESFKPVFVSAVGQMIEPLSQAVTYCMPVKGTVYKDLAQVAYIAGPIGSGAKRGVLYLETAHQDYLDGNADILSYFRAIQRCLADTLNIEVPAEPTGYQRGLPRS